MITGKYPNLFLAFDVSSARYLDSNGPSCASPYMIFALSKYGGRFFFRFDFQEVELSSLPESRQKSYDYERSSKIYSRNL